MFVNDGHGSLFAQHRLVVDVYRHVNAVAVFAVVGRGRRRCYSANQPLRRGPPRQPVFALHELPGELGAPPDVVVAPAPLKRAVRVFWVRAATAARQHSGRAVPGHGVREGCRA